MNNYSVTKSNNLIDASYKLNVQAQKLVLACLAKVDSRKAIPKETSITALEFSELMGIEHNAHRELYKAADALFKSSITLVDDNEEVELYWVQKKVKKLKGQGKITLVWSDDVLKYISELRNRFTSYKLKDIADLQSGYSIRLYELLMRFNDTNVRKISIEEFKAALGISDKYGQFKDLNKWVIKPALKELEKKLNIEVTTLKTGRKITALYFTFSDKKEVQQELDLQQK
jgi:plasmid replication initiation protein